MMLGASVLYASETLAVCLYQLIIKGRQWYLRCLPAC